MANPLSLSGYKDDAMDVEKKTPPFPYQFHGMPKGTLDFNAMANTFPTPGMNLQVAANYERAYHQNDDNFDDKSIVSSRSAAPAPNLDVCRNPKLFDSDLYHNLAKGEGITDRHANYLKDAGNTVFAGPPSFVSTDGLEEVLEEVLSLASESKHWHWEMQDADQNLKNAQLALDTAKKEHQQAIGKFEQAYQKFNRMANSADPFDPKHGPVYGKVPNEKELHKLIESQRTAVPHESDKE